MTEDEYTVRRLNQHAIWFEIIDGLSHVSMAGLLDALQEFLDGRQPGLLDESARGVIGQVRERLSSGEEVALGFLRREGERYGQGVR